jgi:hypothetical protein
MQLTIATGESQGALGHEDLRFHFRNHSMHSCTLIGRPHIVLLRAGGSSLPTHERHGPGYMTRSQPRRLVELKPMGLAYFTIEWENVPTGSEKCPAAVAVRVRPPQDHHALTISLPHGGITPCGGNIIVTRVGPKPVG